MILMDGKIPYRRIAVGYLIIGLVIPISPLQQTWPHLWMVYPIRVVIFHSYARSDVVSSQPRASRASYGAGGALPKSL